MQSAGESEHGRAWYMIICCCDTLKYNPFAGVWDEYAVIRPVSGQGGTFWETSPPVEYRGGRRGSTPHARPVATEAQKCRGRVR